MQQPMIVHACCGSYEQGLFGGVPRFDHQFRRTFPNRELLTTPQQVRTFCEGNPNCIVFADNHYANHVPASTTCVVVHHGCAAEHFVLTGDASLESLALEQAKIWALREPENTLVMSCSTFCIDMFKKHYGEAYERFDRFLLLHACEHPDYLWVERSIRDNSPIRVLGNFATAQKGGATSYRLACEDISIHSVRVSPPTHNNYADFERRKQTEYAKHDVFLQLSRQEGFSYATLDALAMGMPVVATSTGLCYKDMPEQAFVRIDINAGIEEVRRAVRRAHLERDALSKAAIEFCRRETRFEDWQNKLKLVAVTAMEMNTTVV